MIEEKERVNSYSRLYPHTRTTIQTETKIAKRGSDYLTYAVGDPIEMDAERYTNLDSQARAYISICEALCNASINYKGFSRLAKALVLRYESDAMQELAEEYPLATLSGIRFGTDTMIDQNGNFKTVEVNLGPVGGPPEAIKVQTFFNSDSFPVSSNDYVTHFIHSLDSFYQKACHAMAVDPKPLEERQLVIVENDEWTPGNFIWLDLLREKGINVEIVPREALIYDEKTNKLNLEAGSDKKSVDQVILYFHLQDDINKNSEEPGDIVLSLINKGTVVESSPLPLIVLASKSIACLVSQIAQEPDGRLAQKLGLNRDDLEIVRNMFPKTSHWRRNFFKQMDKDGFARTDLLDYLKSRKLILKSVRTNLFAGVGVFGTDNKTGRKGYDDFFQSLKEEVYKRLVKEGIGKYFAFVLRDDFMTSMINNGSIDNPVKFQQIILALINRLDIETIQNVTPEINAESYQKVSTLLQQPEFANEEEAATFFREFAMILNMYGDVNNLSDKILSYISTFMLLPFVLQERINTSDSTELRVSGFVGENSNDVLSMISTLKRPEKEGELKSVHVIVPKIK